MQTIEKYYADFHDYLTKTNVEKMSFKKLDKFINVLYYDWPVSRPDLYAFVEYRESQAKKIEVPDTKNAPVLSEDNTILRDPKYLPLFSPEKVFEIYGLSGHFIIGCRGWCGHRYSIYSVNENNRMIEEKIEYINQLIRIMEKFKQIYSNGGNIDSVSDLDILELYRLFNKIFLNIKNFRSIIPREKFDRVNDVFRSIEKMVYSNEKEYLNVILKKPEKVIAKYNLDKLFKIRRGKYPIFDYQFILRKNIKI